MPKFLIGWLLGLAANAIALIVCTLLFKEKFSFESWTSFVVCVVVFAILSALFTWFCFKFLMRHAGSLVALTGLASTFLALLVTATFFGLDIDGVTTWVLSTLLIWIISMFIWVIPGPWRKVKKDVHV